MRGALEIQSQPQVSGRPSRWAEKLTLTKRAFTRFTRIHQFVDELGAMVRRENRVSGSPQTTV
jgi:hypothetical protein